MLAEPAPGIGHRFGKRTKPVAQLVLGPFAGKVVPQHRHAGSRRVDRRLATEHGGGQITEPAGGADSQWWSIAQRWPAAGHLGEDTPSLEVGQWVPAENIAATGLAPGSCCLDAADDVPNIDKVVRARWCQQPLAAADLKQHTTTGGLPVPGANHVDGVDDDGIKPPVDLRQHGRLCLPLGHDIGALHHSARRSLFICRHAVSPQAESIDARDMDEAGAGAAGRLCQPSRPFDVDPVHLLTVPPATVDNCCRVNHQADTIDRLLQAGLVLQRACPLIDRKSLEGSISVAPAGPDQNPHLSARIEQTADGVVAD